MSAGIQGLKSDPHSKFMSGPGGLFVEGILSSDLQDLTVQDKHLLEARGLSKAFGTNQVLTEVSFTLDRGESVALVGENGAGKSTMARILAGALHPDQGELLVDGRPIELKSPRDALERGISFIPQELAYIPSLTVAENVLVGQWPSRLGLTSDRAIRNQAQLEIKQFGIDLDASRSMAALSLAERQLVEIVKALAHRAAVVIMDEPTAALSDSERQILFEILRTLNARGVGLVYISHRIDEIFEFAHRIDVMRNGELVASLDPERTKSSEVIHHMLGRAAGDFSITRERSPERSDRVLRLRNWSYEGRPSLSNLNLNVGHGEIVGLFGLRGSGADVVVEGLAGLRPELDGELIIEGRPRGIFQNPRTARKHGIVYTPPERKYDGLVLGLSVQANISLGVLRNLSRLGLLSFRAERALAERLSELLEIQCQSLDQRVGTLSGGNQQKVMLASRLAAGPQVLVLNEPTRGVDVGTRIGIHKFLRGLADEGTAVLWATTDAEEAVAVSDRLVVVRDGRVAAELLGESITQENALSAAEADLPA